MTSDYELIAIGASWGGLRAVSTLLAALDADAGVAVVVAQHRAPGSPQGLAELLQERTQLTVQEAEDKEAIEHGHVYLAPPDYHLLVERGGGLALSTDDRVQYARPSIDVLFESAADAYREHCIGVVLTGLNEDGAAGLARIKELGGVAIVEDPRTAERSEMPAAALAATNADVILPLAEIGLFLYGLLAGTKTRTTF